MERRMVIPGELIAEGNYKLGEGVFAEQNKIYSSVLGFVDENRGYLRIIPLTGKYMPKVEDYVVGIVSAIEPNFWELDINSAYSALLNADDYYRDVDYDASLTKVMPIGEVVYAMIREVTPKKKVYVTMRRRGARVLRGGRIVKIVPTKVPRVIGKNSSMITMIKKETGCDILVGQNGRVWINGTLPRIDLAARVIATIEREAHTSGLTERIKQMITTEREKI